LGLAELGIFLSSWLGATARKELGRFKEFMAWLRYGECILRSLYDKPALTIFIYSKETANTNPSNDSPPILHHDILEVNNYFISGLAESILDRWFAGPVPSFSLSGLVETRPSQSLFAAMEEALRVIETPDAVEWQSAS
jgi:anaphase-promoting complex subunit 4